RRAHGAHGLARARANNPGMARIAIHGFGRIGRSGTRVALADGPFTPVAIPAARHAPTLAAPLVGDTNHRRRHDPVPATRDPPIIGEREIRYFDVQKELPDWKALGVDLVIDCTGRATTRAGAEAHFARGARRVLVSAPSKSRDDCDAFLLPGINLDAFDRERHRIVSMASCSSNTVE